MCDDCALRDDPDLVAILWRIRAEIDRGERGAHTEAWLATLDPSDRHFTDREIDAFLSQAP